MELRYDSGYTNLSRPDHDLCNDSNNIVTCWSYISAIVLPLFYFPPCSKTQFLPQVHCTLSLFHPCHYALCPLLLSCFLPLSFNFHWPFSLLRPCNWFLFFFSTVPLSWLASLFYYSFIFRPIYLSLSPHVLALSFLLRSSAVCCWRFWPKTSQSSSRPRCSWCGPSWWERCTGMWRGLTRTWAGCRCPARRCEALGGEQRVKEVHLWRVLWWRFHRRGWGRRVKPVQLCIYLGDIVARSLSLLWRSPEHQTKF